MEQSYEEKFDEFKLNIEILELEIKKHYSGIHINDNEIKNSFFETYSRKIIVDGLVNIGEFFNSKFKILWILKEARDIEDNKSEGYDLVKDLNEKRADGKNRTSWQTFDKIIYTTYAIENNLNTFDEIGIHASNPKIASYLRKIAYINIQKLAATKNSKNDAISNQMLQHKDILKKQILTINPKIIINCSKQNVINIFSEAEIENIKIIDSNHPSYWVEKSSKFTNKILDKLKSK